MTQLIPNDPAAMHSVTEGMVRWAPNDAYEQAIGKPEYAGRVHQAGPNVLLVRGTTYSYYTPSQTRSSSLRQSSSTQDERISSMEIELEVQKAARRALELQLSQIESMLTSGVCPTTRVTPQSPAPDGDSTTLLGMKSSSGSVGMITFV
jgi:hypothetical protein